MIKSTQSISDISELRYLHIDQKYLKTTPTLLLSGKKYRSIRCCTTRLQSSSLYSATKSLLCWLDYNSCLSLYRFLCVCSFGYYKINSAVQPWWHWNKSLIVNPAASGSGVVRGDRRGQHNTQSCNVDPPTTKKLTTIEHGILAGITCKTVFLIRFRPLCQKELSDLWTLWRKSPWPYSHVSVLQQRVHKSYSLLTQVDAKLTLKTNPSLDLDQLMFPASGTQSYSSTDEWREASDELISTPYQSYLKPSKIHI